MKNIPKGKLKLDGESGDNKRAFVIHSANDGYMDLRIEVDTDDCDRAYATAMMREMIRRWNSFEK